MDIMFSWANMFRGSNGNTAWRCIYAASYSFIVVCTDSRLPIVFLLADRFCRFIAP